MTVVRTSLILAIILLLRGGGSCGKTRVPLNRIISGRNAAYGAWPWQVSLKYYNSILMCGGVLIAPKQVLTVAHCFDNIPKHFLKDITVVSGDHTLNRNESTEQYSTISHVDIHEDYSSPTIYNNDVALVTLARPIRFNAYVSPVCLPKHNETVKVNRTCYVTGWGRSSLTSFKMANVLQQTSLKTMSQTECYNKNNNLLPVTDTMFCATNKSPALKPDTACHGDSGGPLVCQETDGSWMLNGLVSWGSSYCDTSDGYTVFVRISQYMRWVIEKQLKVENLKKSVIT